MWNKQFHSCSTLWNLLFHSVELKYEFLADFCSTVTPQFSSTVATQLFHTLSNSTLWKNSGKWTKSWNIIFHSFSTVFTQMGHTFHILWNTLVFSSGSSILVFCLVSENFKNSVAFLFFLGIKRRSNVTRSKQDLQIYLKWKTDLIIYF